MAKTFMFCFSLNSGAAIMAASNFMFAILAIVGSTVELYYKHSKEDELYLIVTIIMGVYNLIAGAVLVAALIMGKERLVLLYILLELSNLFILTIFAVINIFGRTPILILLFVLCIILWYGLYGMWEFYQELAEFNSVKSGHIEITYSTNVNQVMFPDRAVESTTV